MAIGVGVGGGKLCPFQSILINNFVAGHNKFYIKIEKGRMTESVVLFSKHDILNVLE